MIGGFEFEVEIDGGRRWVRLQSTYGCLGDEAAGCLADKNEQERAKILPRVMSKILKEAQEELETTGSVRMAGKMVSIIRPSAVLGVRPIHVEEVDIDLTM